MTVLDWVLLRSIRSTLNVEHADESELQKIEDAADELSKLSSADEIQEVRDLQTLVGVAQKVIKVKTMQAEAAIEELETAVKDSGMAQENERLRRELARLKSGDLQDENQLKKLRDDFDEVQLLLKREKQNSVKFEGLYADAERERKSLQVEVLALQTELDEKVKDAQRHEVYAANQMNEKQVIAKLKEKNDQITKLMLALQEEESVNEDLRTTIDQLGAKLRDATVEINQSADLIEDLRGANSVLRRQVEQSGREKTTLEGLVDEYMNRINELEALQPNSDTDKLSRSSSGDRLDTWRGILETKNTEIHDLQIRIVHLQQEFDSVLSSTNMSTLKVLKKAIAEKDEQIKSLADSLSQATLDIEDNTRIIETLKGELVSKGHPHKDEKNDRERLRKAEDTIAELEKQLLDREEQLAEALLVARKYEMGVYGLCDAVTEVRVCKRKIASRDKNIARLQEQLAESYVEAERLTRENEQLCQGLIPTSKKVPKAQHRQDSIEAEKTILALEEEILTLKQDLRDLQRNLVDNVHKVSSDWNPLWDKGTQKSTHGSSDEENLDRCQISQISSKRQDSQDTDAEANDNDVEIENQKLKEFLIQILEALQRINNQRNGNRKISSSRPVAKDKLVEDKRTAPPTPVKRKLTKDMPKEMRLLREFVSDVLDENQKLANDLDSLRTPTKANHEEKNIFIRLFESAQQQVLRQRSLLSVYFGVLVEQLAYADCLQEVYRRQLHAHAADAQEKGPRINLSYNINFDYTAELKQQIRQLNDDIVGIKKTLKHDADSAIQTAVDDQTENLFMLEKLRMQIETLSKQHLKVQKLLAEREGELMQIHERLLKAQATPLPAQPAVTVAEPETDNSVTAGINSDDDDDEDTVQEESQTESERSVSQNFYRRMDSLREYNRKLCSELTDAKYILKRTQDALKIKDVMLKEVNKQQAACGNLEQKMKVMEISLDTTKKLLGHKEQTLERYRQLVTDLKQELISAKVKCNADIQHLEKAHMNELYQAKKQIAELTMKAFHQQQLALDNDAVPDQGSFEKILAEKQVQIVHLQNKVKSLTTVEFRLKSEVEQANDSNQRMRETIMEMQERLRAFERLKQPMPPVQLEVPAIITTPDLSSEVVVENDDEQKESELEEEVSDLKERLSAAENKVARLRVALDDAKEKNRVFEAEIEQQNAKIDQLRKIQSLRRTDPKRMKILEDDIENLRRQLYEAKQQRAEKPYDEVEKQAKQSIEVARWEESKKWQIVVEGLKEQLKDKHTMVERLEAAQALLRAQIVRLEKEKYKLLDRIKAGAIIGSEHSQTIDALLKKIQQLERTVAHYQKPPKRHRPKENQIVPILVSPLSPRRHKDQRSVSFDASVIDNEPASTFSEPEEADESRLEDEPMPPDL